MHWLKHRHRGQAPSHIWTVAAGWTEVVPSPESSPPKTPSTAASPMSLLEHIQKCGRGLAPIAADQSPEALAETPPSGASPLPHLDRGSRLDRSSPITRIKPTENTINCGPPMSLLEHIQKCGRGLAPDCAGSVARGIG